MILITSLLHQNSLGDFVLLWKEDILIFILTFYLSYVILKWKNLKNSNTDNQNKHSQLTCYSKIPGPRPLPIFGNGPQLGPASHKKMKEWAEKYGPVYKIKLGGSNIVVLNTYSVIKEAMVKKKAIFSGRPHFPSYRMVSRGMGVVFNDAYKQKDWFAKKKLMSKVIHDYALSAKTREGVLKHVYAEINYMVDEIEKLCQEGNGYVDPEPVVRLSISNAVCAICFGQRFNIEDTRFTSLLEHNRKFGKVIQAGSMVDVMPWLSIIPYFRKVVESFQELNENVSLWTEKNVNNHLKTYDQNVTRDILDCMVTAALDGKADSLLTTNAIQTLKQYGITKLDSSTPTCYSNNELFDVVDANVLSALTTDIFGAAQDTLSSALLFILHYMIRYPEVQQKIHQELDEVIGDVQPEFIHKVKLVYLEATFHEVMRHSTFVSLTIPHLTLQDSSVGGYHVKKNTLVFVNQYAANYDTDYWLEPQKFNPDRFIILDSNGNKKLNSQKIKQYLIFSSGARKCPGEELSLSWLIMSMAVMMHKCYLTHDPLDPPTDDVFVALTLKPSKLRLKMQKFR